MAAMMTIKGFPSSLPEAEIKGLLETIGQVSDGLGGRVLVLHAACGEHRSQSLWVNQTSW